MLWSVLGGMTAIWLMFTPALWPEAPLHAWLAAGVGVAALAVTALGVPSRRIRKSMAWLGLFLGLVNFGLGGPLGLIASYAVSAIFLVAAGMSPTPELASTAVVEAARTQMVAHEEELPRAA